MHFRSNNLHLRWTYTPPPLEILVEEPKVGDPAPEVVMTEAEARINLPTSKTSYPPEVPQEIEPVDLPLIITLPPPSVTWLEQPQEPIEQTMPAPVRTLLKRTRKLYLAPKGCLSQQGWGIVCMRQYGRQILAARAALMRPPSPLPRLKVTRRYTSSYTWRNGRWNPLRRPVSKTPANHSGPPRNGGMRTGYNSHRIDVHFANGAPFMGDVRVYLNGTLLITFFDVVGVGELGMTSNGAPLHSGLLYADTATFAESLFKESGNIVRLEIDNEIGTGPPPCTINVYGWYRVNGIVITNGTGDTATIIPQQEKEVFPATTFVFESIGFEK